MATKSLINPPYGNKNERDNACDQQANHMNYHLLGSSTLTTFHTLSSFYLTVFFDNWDTDMKIRITPINGKYHCPHEDCNAEYDATMADSIRRHYKRKHGCENTISVHIPVSLSIEQKRVRQQAYALKAKQKKHGRRARRRQTKKQSDYISAEDAEKHGAFESRNPNLEYRRSNIEGAGNGIFALRDFSPGDIATWVSGEKSQTRLDDKSYTIGLSSSDFLHGLRVPIKGKGLGSFINREERNQPKMRKNCSFIECPKEKHDIYIEVTQPIKSGRELYTTYSHGYRIKKKNLLRFENLHFHCHNQ